ncbi:MAG: LysR family transcriptional regulator [Clostridia bacterium]|jgi:DNA-binding transcriptional LysR family regulator
MTEKQNISLDSYRVFCAVAKHKSLTKAAEELYITQPSVSMAISKLEKQLGSKLLTRSAKRVSLTREGEVMYSYLKQAMNLIDTAEEKFWEMQLLKSGEVVIGASDTLSANYLLPYLQKYFELYPEIQLKVTNRTTSETIELLKNGTVDFGFVNLPIKKDNSLEVYECMHISDVLIGGRMFKHLAKIGVRLEDLNNYHLIMLEKASNTRNYIDDYAQSHNVTLNPVIELGSSEILVKFAGINLGLTFVVKEFYGNHIDNENLFEIKLTPPIPKRSIGLVKLRGIPFSQAATKFIELMSIDVE